MTPPTLYVLTGLPGSGKSTRAHAIAARTGAAHVSMDDAMVDRGLSIVDFDARFAVQPEVEASIGPMLEAGHSVIAEFGSWDRDERDRLRGIGVAAGARTELHWLDAPVDVCIERVRARGGDGADVLANAILRDSAHQYRAPAPDETDHYDRYVAPGEEWQA